MWLQQGHSGKEAGCGDGTSSEQQQLRRRGGRGGCSHPNVSSYPGDVSEGMKPLGQIFIGIIGSRRVCPLIRSPAGCVPPDGE